MVDKPLVLEPNVTNIARVKGITRSSMAFTLEQLQNKILDTSKGKKVSSPNMEIEPSKMEIPHEEAEEFLRIIKKRDYKMEDQLSQTPSKKSIFSLLLSS